MTRTFSRRQRLSMLFIAAAQLVLPPALTVVDGYQSAAAPESAVFAHVESHGTPKCPRVHDDDNCAVCHFLSRSAPIKSDAAVCPRILERIAPFLPEVSSAPSLASAAGPSLPRAPPLA